MVIIEFKMLVKGKKERMSIGMCIRVGIGVMIGIFTDNIPLCICFGISIGMGIGSLIKK